MEGRRRGGLVLRHTRLLELLFFTRKREGISKPSEENVRCKGKES
jgi:hypothetical protein